MQPDPENLFFIVGTGRCGSTLLQVMLSSHSRIYIPPELRYFGRHDPVTGFTDPLQDSQVEPYLANTREDIWWQDMGLDQDAFEAAVRGGIRDGRSLYLWVLDHVAAKRGNDKPRFGEKTPYYVLFADRIAEMFPRSKFIHLHRDPRDVAASYLDQYWVQGGTALRCASYLLHVFRRVERLERELGTERFCHVKYEALVESPEEELRRLCGFLGEEYEPEMLRYGERKDAGYLKVEEEWKGMTQKPLTASRIGRYREKMSPRQIWTVEHLLRDFLPRFGYEPGHDRAPLSWLGSYWAERIYRKTARTLGLRRPLLDESAVLARRNALIEEQRKEATGVGRQGVGS